MVLRAVAVGSVWLVGVASAGCARTTPVVAPTVVFVGGVSGGGFSESSGSSESGGSWKAKEEVEVQWKGQWWPAVVLERRGSRWLVHYDGYGDEWDEVVGPDRIRERRAEINIDHPNEPEDEPDP